MGWKRYAVDAVLSAAVSLVVGLVMPEGEQKEEVEQKIEGNEKVIIENNLSEENKIGEVWYLYGAIVVLTLIIICLAWPRLCRKSSSNRPRPDEGATELSWVSVKPKDSE